MVGFLNAARADTLLEAMIMAYQNNPTLQAERANLRASDEAVPQALSGWRPNVAIVGSGGYNASSGTGVAGVKQRGLYSGDLQVTQNIYSGGGTVADVKRAENTVRAARARLGITEQGVLLNAVQAYLNVYRDQSVVQLNINNERVLSRQLEATRDRFNVGEVTRTDVSQAEARLASARASRVQAEGALQISRGVYEQIIGKLPENLAKPDAVKRLPTSRQGTIDAARKENPSVLAADYDERAARDNVSVVESDLLPKVDIVGTGGRSVNQFSPGTTSDAGSIIAQLTVPLYQRGSVSSQVRQAKQVVGRNRLLLIEAERSATEQAVNAWESLVSARAQIQSLNAAVRSNRIALEGVRQESLVGSRTVLDVLDAEQELLNSEVNLVSAERDEIVAQYQVLSAIGQLTAQSLSLNTQYYDPEHHYKAVRDKLWGLGDDAGTTEGKPSDNKK